MFRKTFIIKDSNNRYYSSCFKSYLTTSHSGVLIKTMNDISQARLFHFLWWATARAKYLSINSSNYFYVFEVTIEDSILSLKIRNSKAIDIIKTNDIETMKKIEKTIDKWKRLNNIANYK